MATRSGPPPYVVREVGSETIVYDPRTHRAHCLGPGAAAVWRECDGQRSAADIAERVRLPGGETIDEASVEIGLRRLGRAGLLERQAPRTAGDPKAPGPSPPAGRRAALRRVAALAGLTVASVIAPTPEAAAATCTPNQVFPDGGASRCQTSGQCCSRCCVTTVLFGNRCRPMGSGNCLP